MHSFSRGLVAAIPIASGYIPVAITFGLVVRSVGLSTMDAALASLMVFAGAAQFLAIGMYGAAGLVTGELSSASLVVIAQIVIAGLMSSVIAHNLGGSPGLPSGPNSFPRGPGVLTRSVLAFGVTDEVFGVAGWRIAEGGTVRPRFLLGLEVGAYSAWVGGTLVGALSGEILPDHLRVAMGLALYALFAALLAGQVRAAHRKEGARVTPLLVAAGSAASINAALRMGLGWDAGAAFPIAMVAGAVIAMAARSGDEPESGPGAEAATASAPGEDPRADARVDAELGAGPPASGSSEAGTARGRSASQEEDARGSY
jgi:predicted branched-subunit amino acid permease